MRDEAVGIARAHRRADLKTGGQEAPWIFGLGPPQIIERMVRGLMDAVQMVLRPLLAPLERQLVD
jgi:hypothetical protein